MDMKVNLIFSKTPTEEHYLRKKREECGQERRFLRRSIAGFKLTYVCMLRTFIFNTIVVCRVGSCLIMYIIKDPDDHDKIVQCLFLTKLWNPEKEQCFVYFSALLSGEMVFFIGQNRQNRTNRQNRIANLYSNRIVLIKGIWTK